jgi:hypothetical protein
VHVALGFIIGILMGPRFMKPPHYDKCDNCGGEYIRGRRDEHSCSNFLALQLTQEINTGDFDRKMDAWLASASGRTSRLRIEWLRYLKGH